MKVELYIKQLENMLVVKEVTKDNRGYAVEFVDGYKHCNGKGFYSGYIRRTTQRELDIELEKVVKISDKEVKIKEFEREIGGYEKRIKECDERTKDISKREEEYKKEYERRVKSLKYETDRNYEKYTFYRNEISELEKQLEMLRNEN